MHEQRNEEIAVCYVVEGKTLEECGQKFGITRERVRQILRKNGIFKAKKTQKVGLNTKGVVEEGRDVFLGINISESDKRALREEAERRGISMSRLSSDLLKGMLEKMKQETER